jgi:hypothetical protein
MGDITQRIKEANGRLKANCFGVTIEQIGIDTPRSKDAGILHSQTRR